MNRLIPQEQLFMQIINGGGGELNEVLDLERRYLFDYLMRMTRQYNRALETIEEVFAGAEQLKDTWKSLRDLRLALYFNARCLCRDIWNSDTRKLENQAINTRLSDSACSLSELEELRAYQILDRQVAGLPPDLRECVLLHHRHDFSIKETAAIMEVNAAVVAENIGSALKRMQSLQLPAQKTLEGALYSLQFHEMPEERTIYMTDLKEVMGGLKKSMPDRWMRILRLLLILGVTGAMIYLYFFEMEMISQFFAWCAAQL